MVTLTGTVKIDLWKLLIIEFYFPDLSYTNHLLQLLEHNPYE